METPNRSYVKIDMSTPVSGPAFTSYYTRPTALIPRNLLKSFGDIPNMKESFISNHTNTYKYVNQNLNPETYKVLGSKLKSSFVN
jgi:hypothetical protein